MAKNKNTIWIIVIIALIFIFSNSSGQKEASLSAGCRPSSEYTDCNTIATWAQASGLDTSGTTYVSGRTSATCSGTSKIICVSDQGYFECENLNSLYSPIKTCGSATPSCSDSDGGNVPLVKGTVTSSSGSFSDFCDMGQLLEYSCDAGEITGEFILCDQQFGSDYECDDGKCVSNPQCTPDSQRCNNGNVESCDFDNSLGDHDWSLFNDCSTGFICEMRSGFGVCVQDSPSCFDSGDSCTSGAQCCGGLTCTEGKCISDGTCLPSQVEEQRCNNGNVEICDISSTTYLSDWNLFNNCPIGFSCDMISGFGVCVQDAPSCFTSGDTCVSDSQCCGGFDCVSGQCESSGAVCTETDGGNNPSVAGSTSFGTITKPDVCLDSTRIQEFYCVTNKNLPSTSSVTICEGSCSDGECVAEIISGLGVATGQVCCDKGFVFFQEKFVIRDDLCLAEEIEVEDSLCDHLLPPPTTPGGTTGTGTTGGTTTPGEVDACNNQCTSFIQECDGATSKCKTSGFIWIIGLFVLLLVVLKVINKPQN